jgi:GNAT superfamily N-acetyltransferase
VDVSHKHIFDIRRAVFADAERVQDFVFAILRSYDIEPDPEGLDAPVVAFGMAGGDGSVLELVAEVSGTVVGAIALASGEVGKLTLFYVVPAYRGSGIGRALLERIMKEAKALGVHLLYLETRAIFREAVHLYEATGWVRGLDLPPEYGPDRSYVLRIAQET